jgi:hypothetical protein
MRTTWIIKRLSIAVLGVGLLAGTTGAANANELLFGGLVGGASGAGIGAAFGGAKGAAIGGVAGLGVGVLAGHLIKESKKQEAPAAYVPPPPPPGGPAAYNQAPQGGYGAPQGYNAAPQGYAQPQGTGQAYNQAPPQGYVAAPQGYAQPQAQPAPQVQAQATAVTCRDAETVAADGSKTAATFCQDPQTGQWFRLN